MESRQALLWVNPWLFIWSAEVRATLISWPRDFGGSSCPRTPMLISHQNGKRGETNLLIILWENKLYGINEEKELHLTLENLLTFNKAVGY